jgi:L-serine dehydratase
VVVPVSAFELFKIGIGPSSSHTVGPMLAAHRFLDEAKAQGAFDRITALTVELFGSLALTGRGHGTDRAILFGLLGEKPDSVDVASAVARAEEVRRSGRLYLLGERGIAFDEKNNLLFHTKDNLRRHPNGLRFSIHDVTGALIFWRNYYSIGGGFVIGEDEEPNASSTAEHLPFDYRSAQELLNMAASAGLRIDEVAFANETARRSPEDVRARLDRIWSVMRASIDRGLSHEGELPGAFQVRRRAPALYRRLNEDYGSNDPQSPPAGAGLGDSFRHSGQ